MPNTTIRRAGLAGVLVAAGGLLAGPGTAQAAPLSGASAAGLAGVADAGSAAFTKGTSTIIISPVAPCSVDGPETEASGAAMSSGVAFGGGKSSCTTKITDPATSRTETTSTTTGKNFELSALVSARGPRVKLGSYTVTCTGMQRQTSANWTYSGLSGITGLPSPIPVNYAKPLTRPDGTVLATAVFNAQTTPGNGSIGLTMLRIDFAPASGISGSVSVGRTACSPTP
ncbi:hypothetical protein [Amycolatopsis panacis]|uniref:Tat pathway signal sequence domain protein n=1 Tax=Amycolatopsis panacis TaxID=2340917 RepID=A0A419I398_9PSEU|nr:hypothetical protein [Amycolatopsis panacis]RJQ84550.1 hypothetical protein D5S19_16505 [Amycolatopsis panacis]